MSHWLLCMLIISLPFAAPRAAQDPDTLLLLVQPILSAEKTRAAFQPLADYITKLTGKYCMVRTMPNFLAYWDAVRRPNDYDLVLDAAHFTDYRASKLGFTVLAKIPDTVSYSLVVPDNMLIFDPTELIGKRVATLGPPSIGAARLNGMFPNPVRQPMIIEVESSEQGMQMLLNHQVDGAILPTPLVSRQMTQGGGISVVTTTEPIPHIALSASPRLDAALREKIRIGVLDAAETPDGRKMLRGIGFSRFDPATAAIYAGQRRILKEFWGY